MAAARCIAHRSYMARVPSPVVVALSAGPRARGMLVADAASPTRASERATQVLVAAGLVPVSALP